MIPTLRKVSHRTDVINCRVAQIPVSLPTMGNAGTNQNHQDSEIDPKIVQEEQPAPRSCTCWLTHFLHFLKP